MDACPVANYCRGLHKDCLDCSGSLPPAEVLDSTLPLLYRKLSPTAPDHPVVAAKRERALEGKEAERRRKQSQPFKTKSKLVRKAFKNEADTRKEIVRATQRSGAANGDGDTRIGDGQWGIDDKLMTTTEHQFTLRTSDIDKASRQNCVIVVTLKNGRKFVVAELLDFCSAAAAMEDACKKSLLTPRSI